MAAIARLAITLRDEEAPESVGTDNPDFVQKTRRMSYEMFLERSPSGGVSSNGGTFVVPASDQPTEVSVIPTLTGTADHSHPYTAALRRRKMGALSKSLNKLINLGNDDRFVLAVDDVIAKVEAMLREFAASQREGNTREILRTLRNCLRNAGWDRFRDSKTAERITHYLEVLQNKEWLTPEHVRAFHDLVDSLGLDLMTLSADHWPD